MLIFLILNVLVLASAWRIVRWMADGRHPPVGHLLLDAGLVALALIVVIELGLGTLGWLNRNALILTVVLVAMAALALTGRREGHGFSCDVCSVVPTKTWWAWGVVLGLAVFAGAQVVWARWLAPPATTDALCYHLPFAATWIQRGDLSMPVPAAGDPSTPFYPLNSSLWVAWGILPLGSDFVARMSQAPFILLLAAAAIRLGRRVGLSRASALGVGALVALLPDIARSAFVVENDVVLTALLLAATAYILEVWNAPRASGLVLGAVALGLALGTKTMALPYVAFLTLALLAAIIKGWRREGWPAVISRSCVVLSIILLLGGYTYVRNAVVMGNPFYPVRVALGDAITLPGLYAVTPEWKARHPFYAFDWRSFLWQSRAAFGWTLPVWILPGLVLALYRAVRERRLVPLLFFLWIAATVAIFWFALPYHFSRFLYSTVCWAVVLAAWGWERVVGARRLPVLVLPLLIVDAVSIPKFAQAWRSPAYWGVGVFSIAMGLGLVWVARRGVSRKAALRLAVVASVASALLLGGGWFYERVYVEQRYERWQRSPGGGEAEAWAWLDTAVNEAGAISASGTCVIYPLYGPALSRPVVTIGTGGNLAEYGWSRPYRQPQEPNRGRWLRTLRAEGVAYLYITPNVVTGEWPVEDRWAAVDARQFRLVFSHPDVHVWRLVSSSN